MRAAVNEFAIRTKPQREWRSLIALALFLAGVGSGAFIISTMVADYPLGSLVGIIVAGGGASLAFFLDLGRKSQFWRVMLRPQTSWISRGILLIVLFTAFGLISLVTSVAFFLWAAVVCAVGVMMYSGFVLSYSPAIPFWNTPLLPFISIVYALMGGVALLFALNPTGPGTKALETMEIGLIVSCAVLIFAYLTTMSSSTVAAREATRAFVAGSLAGLFWGIIVVVGLLAPLALTLSVRADAMPAAALPVAGLLELGGAFAFRYGLLKAGIRLAVA